MGGKCRMGQSMTKIHARRLNKKMKYKGPETMDLTPGETYQCIGEITEGPQTGFYLLLMNLEKIIYTAQRTLKK